jgi:glycosyltransferase involved in cell wall biosynthesis
MRILYINKYNFAFSGTEVYLFSLMKMMAARGHEVALFTMADERGQPSPFDRYAVSHLNFKSADASLFEKARLAAHAIYSVEAQKKLRALIRDFRPDIAHLRNIYHHLSPSVLWELRKQRVPVLYHVNDFKLLCPSYNCVSAQGEACDRCAGGQFWRVVSEGGYHGSRAEAVFLAAEAHVHHGLKTYPRCVNRILAPSCFVRDRLVESGWSPAKIDVLYHYQEPAEGACPDSSASGVLYFGRLSAEKGVADLVRAAHKLPQIQFRIAGEGRERGSLESLTRALDLQNVHFLGQFEGKNLQAEITKARVTVLPSRAYETLGKTILESYACCRPVIASDLGSRRELIVEGKTGLLYPVGKWEQLAAAISFLHARPDLCRSMGENGLQLLRERHSPEDHYERLLGLYHQLSPSNSASRKPLKPLRVAFVGGRGVIGKYSGIEAYYEEVGQRLAARGHQVTVYCRNHFTPDLAEHNGMKLVHIPTLRTKHLETLLHTLTSAIHASLNGSDIVHFHALGPALFSFLPRLFGKKTVVTVQGLDWQRKKWGPLAARVLRVGEAAAAYLPHRTMVVSRTLQHYYEHHYGRRPAYVTNGTIVREAAKHGNLERWKLEPGNYILFLGRFSPEKNCHLLVEAYERITTDVRLVLAGGASYTDAYAAELKRHQNRRVKVLDWVSGDALEELLTNAAIFVLPSDLEGLSLALLDAMGAGICVLTSDVPENRELVDGAGFTFKRGDVNDLERMLRLLLSDPVVRQQAGQAAQKRIAESYLWPQITSEIETIYRQTLGEIATSA